MKIFLQNSTLSILFLFISASLFAQHFQTVWSGNPIHLMNFLVSEATINTSDLAAGDEIAVFDVDGADEICVGTIVLTGPISPYVTFSAAEDDPDTPEKDGYTEGNSIIYRFWDSSEQMEVTVITPNYSAGSATNYTTSGTATIISLDGYVTIWTGTTDNDWHTTTNWSTTSIPGSTEDLLIPTGLTNYPTLTAAGTCKNITLQANASSRASILGNNNLTVSATSTVQTFITADQWHQVSTPVGGQTAEVYYLDGNPKVFITEFDEPTNDYEYITSLSDPLNDMQGYMIWVNTTDQTYLYTGNMNSGTVTNNNLTRTAVGANSGWNMVGNPYPSTIDWEASTGWTLTNVASTVYTYNDGTWATYTIGGGSTNGGVQYIASGQGFFVSVNDDGSTTGSLQMTDDVRVHTATPFLKSSELTNYIKLIASGNDRTDETMIRFTEESSEEFDGQFDAYKKFTTYDEIPQIYTSSDVNYALNSTPSVDNLPLHFQCGIDGEYSISISEIDQIGEVWLEDLLTGETTNLTENTYTFNHLNGADPDRFVVHFSPVSINEKKLESINVYAYNNQLNIKSPVIIEGEFSVYNLMGQQITSGVLNGYSKQLTIYQQGYYLVKIMSKGSVVTKKVFIN